MRGVAWHSPMVEAGRAHRHVNAHRCFHTLPGGSAMYALDSDLQSHCGRVRRIRTSNPRDVAPKACRIGWRNEGNVEHRMPNGPRRRGHSKGRSRRRPAAAERGVPKHATKSASRNIMRVRAAGRYPWGDRVVPPPARGLPAGTGSALHFRTDLDRPPSHSRFTDAHLRQLMPPRPRVPAPGPRDGRRLLPHARAGWRAIHRGDRAVPGLLRSRQRRAPPPPPPPAHLRRQQRGGVFLARRHPRSSSSARTASAPAATSSTS